MLGLEYLYKAGYDPTAFVDFFEKIESLEKRKPGTISKVFSTHPPTDDRIKAAQKNIQEILKAKPELIGKTINETEDKFVPWFNDAMAGKTVEIVDYSSSLQSNVYRLFTPIKSAVTNEELSKKMDISRAEATSNFRVLRMRPRGRSG